MRAAEVLRTARADFVDEVELFCRVGECDGLDPSVVPLTLLSSLTPAALNTPSTST